VRSSDRTVDEAGVSSGCWDSSQKILTLCLGIGIVGSSMNLQSQFDFSSSGTAAGYSNWLAGRQVSVQALARRLNLPVGHEVEVWLRGDVRLKGKLRLQEENLLLEEEAIRHLELQVDRVRFRAGELERCVRLD
jgi:hypothetical protein